MPPQNPQQPQNNQNPQSPQPNLPGGPVPYQTGQDYGQYQPQGLPPLTVQNDQPGQAYPAPAEAKAPDDPYSFIMDSKKAAKQNLSAKVVPGKNASKTSRLFFVLAIAVVLIIIAGIAATLIRNTGKAPEAASLNGVIYDQQEILRVTELGKKNVQSVALQNFVATTRSTITSDQQKTIAYANSHGAPIDSKGLTGYVGDSKVEPLLNAALAASTYDAAFERTMAPILSEYQFKLEQNYRLSALQSQKTLVKKDYDNVVLLQKLLATN